MLAPDEVEQLARWATEDLRPHLTVVLDTEPGQAVHAKADQDRLEAAGEVFHEAVRQFFLELARAGAGALPGPGRPRHPGGDRRPGRRTAGSAAVGGRRPESRHDGGAVAGPS